MLDIKYYRFQINKEAEQQTDKEKRAHLEELAQKYSRWKTRLDDANKHRLQESIKDSKKSLELYYQHKEDQGKAEKIPVKIKTTRLDAILQDKSLIEIYHNFELQYLDHTKKGREENQQRKIELNKLRLDQHSHAVLQAGKGAALK